MKFLLFRTEPKHPKKKRVYGAFCCRPEQNAIHIQTRVSDDSLCKTAGEL